MIASTRTNGSRGCTNTSSSSSYQCSAAPHDTLLDQAGNVWFTDFQHQFISKLNPKTGEVTRYPVPITKPGFPTGGLMVTMDKDGNIWQAMMEQAAIAELDPKTGKVST